MCRQDFLSALLFLIKGDIILKFNRDDMIDVLNYNKNVVCVKATGGYAYMFPPADEDNNPSIIPMPYRDIEFINQSTKAFKDGHLRFNTEEESELYEALRIQNWENIYTRSKIVNMILNPTIEDLKEIINIKSLGVIGKFRGELCRLVNEGHEDISVRLQQVINTRYTELMANQTQSAIQIKGSDEKKFAEIQNNKQVEDLQAEIAELKKMIASMATATNKTEVVEENPSNTSTEIEQTTGKTQTPTKATKKTTNRKTAK